MAFGFIDILRGRRDRLPRDRVTRVPRAAKKAAKAHADAMAATVDEISALPGIADVQEHKRVPRGFYELVETFQRSYDAYVETVRKYVRDGQDEATHRAGQPGGTNACFAAPMGVTGIEALQIYRRSRTWKSFPSLARRLGELGEQQFSDIQAGHRGKDPEKIRVGGKAMQQGRQTFARRKLACPFLDSAKGSCQLGDSRPSVCRMHFPVGEPETADPGHAEYPRGAQALNIRPPIKVQVALAQLDKRMNLQLSPFLYAGQLQLLQLADGQMIPEVGEPPQRMGQDGLIAQRANRNVRGAKKYKKKKKR